MNVDWGDGSEPTPATVTQDGGSGTFTATYQYFDDDPSGTPSDDFTISVTLTDDDTGTDTATTAVTVNNVDPVIADVTVDPAAIDENGTVTLSGNFTDVGTPDTHTVMVDWGDGTEPTSATVTQEAGSGTFSASHQYLDDDPFLCGFKKVA